MVGKEQTLLVITGPTATGKTALAIQLAQHFKTAIISADSRQCYRGMAIGTAQPTPEELALVKHYFVDEFPVTQPVTAAGFERLALEYLTEIFRDSPIAIVCGGTGLYIRALCDGLDEMPEVDAGINAAVVAGYNEHGVAWLQRCLQKEDPGFATNPEWNNPARLMRALSFVRSTGRSILFFRSGVKKERPFRIVKLALELDRPELYRRIDERVDRMMDADLLQEVQALLPFRNCKALHTVGYAELIDYFRRNL